MKNKTDFADLCAVYMAYSYMKSRRKPGWMRIGKEMRSVGLPTKLETYYTSTDSAGRGRENAGAPVCVCVWYKMNSRYDCLDDFLNEMKRYKAYYIQYPLKFVSEPTDNDIMYDGAKIYDIENMRVLSVKNIRRERYRFSPDEWTWKPVTAGPSRMSEFVAVRPPIRDAVPVLVPIDVDIDEDVLDRLLEITSTLL